ncbi:MAG: response regulator [Acidobacteriia bacterium]|nr:response regulator [Terriglobia bacterium]
MEPTRPDGSDRIAGPDWSRLIRVTSADAALEAIAAGFDDPESLDLVLSAPGDGAPELARHRGHAAFDDLGGRRHEARVGGRPEWTLSVRRAGGTVPGALEVERAAAALAAWRSARVEITRGEQKLRARARELDMLQDLGRSASAARTWDALFREAATVLQEGTGADLLVAAHALAGEAEVRVFLARPVTDEVIESLATEAAAAAALPRELPVRVSTERLPGFDGSHALRRASSERPAAAFVPLERRGRTAAALGILPSEPAGERMLRLFFGVANQVALHLERILAVMEAEQDRFRSILDSMPQAVILADRSLRVIQANRAAAAFLGRLAPAGGDGRVPRVGDLDLSPLAADVLERGLTPLEQEARLEGGTVLAVTVSALAGKGGRAEALVLVLADVTERRRLQAQLAQAEKMSSLGEMISGIAHELNNPLSSVLGYSQLACRDAREPKLAARIEVVHREARRCQRIVQNLLSFARRYEPERRLLSVNEVAESVIGLMAYQFRVSDVRIEKDLGRDVPTIVGDPHQLQQAVLNLVSNAYQAIRGAGRGGVITVRTRQPRTGWVSLEVEDDGPGIPETVRSRIFEPFFTTKPPGQGTGLGLSLVEGAVEAHGGRVSLDTGEGHGARFLVELPVGTERVAAGELPRVEEAAGQDVSARILVVDDEDSVARLICETLADDGHRTEPARDGREALDRLRSEEFDLVVADLRMPGMGGASLCEEMERMQPGGSSKILLTTGDTVSREPEALARRKGIAVLTKPFDLDELRRAVRSRLRARRES